MKKSLLSVLLLSSSIIFFGCAQPNQDGCVSTVKCAKPKTSVCKPVVPTCKPVAAKAIPKNTPVLKANKKLQITVIGQGVAPCHGGCSPSQSYALAKRAAIADGYRLIAEKVKGVYVEGEDLIKNMMVERSTIKTSVSATVRNATIVETKMKDGLCEVEMQITLLYSDFVQ